MLYQIARWFAVLGISVALVSEAITYLALLISSFCWLAGVLARLGVHMCSDYGSLLCCLLLAQLAQDTIRILILE